MATHPRRPRPWLTIRSPTWQHCPASSSWQVSFDFEVGDCGAGQAQLHLRWPVEGDRLMQASVVVLDAVVLRAVSQGQGIGDVVEKEPLLL